jgi:hypothetical protein
MLQLLEVQDFLQKAGRGELDSSQLEPLIKKFGQDCEDALRKQLSKRGDFRIRMSGLGRPLCQQQLEQQGNKQDVAYNDVMRFLIGDLVEAVAVFALKGAGVRVVKEQEPCSLELAGQTINGTLDVVLEDMDGEKVWDIKSASPWSYDNKFSKRGGYDVIKEDDAFGYIMQGYLYSESQGKPFGGWIAINKSTGEWDFVAAPENQAEDRDEYLTEAKSRVKHLTENGKFKVPFTAEPERYTEKGVKIETGNKLLPKTCSFCSFKENCWKGATLHPKVTSRAKFKPSVWYSKLVKKEL